MPSLTTPVQLSPNLFIVYAEYPHHDSGNAYLITGRYPTLIDCGSQAAFPRLVKNLEQLGLEVQDLVQVVATHGDYDHVQGYHDLRREHPYLRLHIHRNDWPSVQGSDPYRNGSYIYNRPFQPIAAEQCLPLEEGGIIAVGDTTVRVHHTPGHTDGSVCLLGDIDGRHVLFAGDTVYGGMRSLDKAVLEIWVQAAATWKESLQRLTGLDFEWVLNGHEPVRSLPIGRARFDRAVASFGWMLSPWFALDEEELEYSPDGSAAVPVNAHDTSAGATASIQVDHDRGRRA